MKIQTQNGKTVIKLDANEKVEVTQIGGQTVISIGAAFTSAHTHQHAPQKVLASQDNDTCPEHRVNGAYDGPCLQCA